MSDSSKDGLLALTGSLTGLSIIGVSLRFWTRRQQRLPLLADDWFAAIALVSWIANTICLFILVHDKNLGYSSFDFTPEEIAAKVRNYEVYVIASDVFSTNTIASVRLSALFLYRRIFCVGEKQTIFQTVTRITVVIVVLWLFAFQFLAGFQCGTHFSALWDGSYAEYCTLTFPFLYGLAISDFILDIWLLILPIPSISRLNAKPHRKLLIIGLFFLTVFGLGASIARIVQYVKIEQGGPGFYLHADVQRKFISAMGDQVILSADHSPEPIIGLTTRAIFYITLKCGIALVAINLPTLRVFYAHQNIGGMIRGMRSLIELPFLRRSESNVSQIDLEPAITISNTRNHSSLDC